MGNLDDNKSNLWKFINVFKTEKCRQSMRRVQETNNKTPPPPDSSFKRRNRYLTSCVNDYTSMKTDKMKFEWLRSITDHYTLGESTY